MHDSPFRSHLQQYPRPRAFRDPHACRSQHGDDIRPSNATRQLSIRRIVGFFRLDHLDSRLPQLMSASAVDPGRGENDARRAYSSGFLVQPALALQTGLDAASDAVGDLDEDVLVIMDDHLELLAGDGSPFDSDAEPLFQQRLDATGRSIPSGCSCRRR